MQFLYFFALFTASNMEIREGVRLGYARPGVRYLTIHNSSIVEHPAGNGAVAGLIGRRKLEAYYLLFFFFRKYYNFYNEAILY